ncbi:TlpA family protein disulfide reductase [Sulfurimonas sp. SAG-AH-194-L11]|nr:TlpA disulfide reductase family protein [Sulfurimonas sp. SAG-AH-194-L11]MDF1876806.1 TlpA family protein disulfide reductase [Sulfurimonas sp. SAG-AH-194-L11]
MKKIILVLLLTLSVYAAPRVGDNAVTFTLPALYEESQSLSSEELKGKVVLLNLWASWCSGCKEEMPLFVELQEAYADKGFILVTSSIDNEAQSAKDFLSDVDPKKRLTSLYDADKILPKTYRCPGMPSSFLVDKFGVIREVYIGSIDASSMTQLKNKIDKLLGE